MGELLNYVVSKDAKRYDVRTEGEWAIAFISEEEGRGTLAIISSFGNYCYSWGAIGPKPLRQWLQGINFDYFMNKAAQNRGRVFCADVLLSRLRHCVCDARRQGRLDKATAREYYDELVDIPEDEITGEAHFWGVCPEWLPEFIDYSAPNATVECRQCRGFWDMLWPELLAHWSDELALTPPTHGDKNG